MIVRNAAPQMNLFRTRGTNLQGAMVSQSEGSLMFGGVAWAAALAAGLIAATGAWAKARPPLVPIALVEDVSGTTADVEFMDYVGTGQVITLAPKDVLVLSYLKSCAHETITGGTVRVGADKSEVEGGKVVRTRVACDGGKMRLASQTANASGASSFRLQSAPVEPVLYAAQPMIQLPKLAADANRTLTFERLDKPAPRVEVAVAGDIAAGGYFDLATTDMKPLTRGGVYRASIGGSNVTFRVDAKAKAARTGGKAKPQKLPVLGRLLRFPQG